MSGASGRAARSAMAGQRVIRRDRRRIARRGLVAGGLAGLALVAAAAAGGLWLPRLDLFRIAAIDVRVTPGGQVRREAVLALAGVQPGRSLLAVDLEAVADRIGRHPWVDTVVVRRELPARLVIEVRERRAAAIVQLDRLYFADVAGRIFKPVERGEGADLPVVTGLTTAALAADPAGVTARLAEGLRLLEAAAARLPVAVSELEVDPARGFVVRTAAKRTPTLSGGRPGAITRASRGSPGSDGATPPRGAALRGGPGSGESVGPERAPAGGGLTLVVGEAPFGPKLDRLERIFDHLAAAGEAAERVDLTLGSRAVVRLRVPRPAEAVPSATGSSRTERPRGESGSRSGSL